MRTNRDGLFFFVKAFSVSPDRAGAGCHPIRRKAGNIFVDRGHLSAAVEQVQIWRSRQKRGVTRRLKTVIQRRSAIELTIGHMKSDRKRDRSWLKGSIIHRRIMSTLPLKLISSFMVLVGTGTLIALLIPLTSQYMNPKFPIAITASITMTTGAGLWALKKWAIYLFFGSALITYAANIISFGQPLIGKSWIGLLVVGVLGCVYWKRLS